MRGKSEQGRREDLTSRRVIDIAIGILMGLRGCSEKDAFEDLANAVRETGIGLGGLAGALVDLVANSEGAFPHRDEAIHMWGHLVAGRRAPAANRV
jgi:hypothetical protein